MIGDAARRLLGTLRCEALPLMSVLSGVGASLSNEMCARPVVVARGPDSTRLERSSCSRRVLFHGRTHSQDAGRARSPSVTAGREPHQRIAEKMIDPIDAGFLEQLMERSVDSSGPHHISI